MFFFTKSALRIYWNYYKKTNLASRAAPNSSTISSMGTGIVSLKFWKQAFNLFVSHFFRQQQTARWIWSSFECRELKYSTGWESSPAAEETNVEDDLKPFYNIRNHCQIKDAMKHCPWTLKQIDHLSLCFAIYQLLFWRSRLLLLLFSQTTANSYIFTNNHKFDSMLFHQNADCWALCIPPLYQMAARVASFVVWMDGWIRTMVHSLYKPL